MTIELERYGNLPDIPSALGWTWTQLVKFEEAFNTPQDVFYLNELHAPPRKLSTGMLVLADGSDWNPGAGQGVYTYYANAWHKLG